MLRPRPSGAIRLLSALLALGLSGAPRLASVEPHAGAHRCQCPRGEGRHECDCPACRAQALAARAAGIESLPPCHQALARAELAREEERSRPPPGDCVAGLCGLPEQAPGAVDGVDPFALPEGPVVLLPERSAAVPAAPAATLRVSLQPEIPPPRRA